MTSSVSCADPDIDGSGFQHLAIFYEGLDDLVAKVVPFVREGVDRSEPVLVALLPERATAVASALGGDANRVRFVDMAMLGANPACIIPEWRRFVQDVGGKGPFRGVGEPVWSGRRDVEIEEAGLHEALLNLAFDDGPGWQLMCPYDTSTLPRHVLEAAVRNHPIVRADVPVEGEYAGHELAHAWFAEPLPPAPADAYEWPFEGHDLAGLRSIVARLAREAGVDRASADDLVLAAHELATNSVVHADGRGTMRAWREPGASVVEIEDHGRIADPLVGRGLLEDLAEGGRGVRMANQLCDLVQVRSGDAGTVIRLFAWV